MSNSQYIQILDFLDVYGGNQYKMLKKCTPGAELDYMTKGSDAGKNARKLFSEIVALIASKYDLKMDKITQWQNSGTFVSYFWCPLKREKYQDSNISLSLFAEKGTEAIRFRASVELTVATAGQTDKDSYKRILELPLAEGLTYISGGNNEAEFKIIDETDNIKVSNAKYKKVQVSFIVNRNKVVSDDELINSLSKGIDNLMTYYDYALSEEMDEENGEETDDGTNEESIENSVGGKSEKMPVKDIIKHICSYIEGAGFNYDTGLIENFYLSLKSKPFVILAGTSGTGKTRLVRLFAEAIGATSANGRYCQVAVRPDWSDSTDLFGHADLNGKFVPGAILPFLKEATNHPNHPYILCLDEMNLARVEYYMSDFLSIIESRDLSDGKITSDLIMTTDKYGNDQEAIKAYGEIGFPQNLYIVGTVNMDETTFPFSRKVLDRANTIEFNYVNLGLHFSDTHDVVEPYEADNSLLMSEYLVLNRDCHDYFDLIGPICAQLESMNQVLQKANAHVGYRVRDEIVFYMLNNKKANLLVENEAFDNVIMQKILPRIQGSSNSVRDMLCEFFALLTGQKVSTSVNVSDVVVAMQKTIDDSKRFDDKKLSYQKSAEKIVFMVKRFEEDGFTSYWL